MAKDLEELEVAPGEATTNDYVGRHGLGASRVERSSRDTRGGTEFRRLSELQTRRVKRGVTKFDELDELVANKANNIKYLYMDNDGTYCNYFPVVIVYRDIRRGDKIEQIHYRLLLEYTQPISIPLRTLDNANKNREKYLNPSESFVNKNLDDAIKEFLADNGISGLCLDTNYVREPDALVTAVENVIGQFETYEEQENLEIKLDFLREELNNGSLEFAVEPTMGIKVDDAGNQYYSDIEIRTDFKDGAGNNPLIKDQLLDMNMARNDINITNTDIVIDWVGDEVLDEKTKEKVIRFTPELIVTGTRGLNPTLSNSLVALTAVAGLGMSEGLLNRAILDTVNASNDIGLFNKITKSSVNEKGIPDNLSFAGSKASLENKLTVLRELVSGYSVVHIDIDDYSMATTQLNIFGDSDINNAENIIAEAFKQMTGYDYSGPIIDKIITLPKIMVKSPYDNTEVDSRALTLGKILKLGDQGVELETIAYEYKNADNSDIAYGKYLELIMAIDPEARVIGQIYRVTIATEFLNALLDAFSNHGISIQGQSVEQYEYVRRSNRRDARGLRIGSTSVFRTRRTLRTNSYNVRRGGSFSSRY